jgi:hypothetical protein
MRIITGAVDCVLFFLLLSVPALAASDSSAADNAITGGAALGAALIAGGVGVIAAKQASGAASQAADDAQLRAVRQQAAEDIRAVGETGAELEKAVSELLASAGLSQEARSTVLAKSAELTPESSSSGMTSSGRACGSSVG